MELTKREPIDADAFAKLWKRIKGERWNESQRVRRLRPRIAYERQVKVEPWKGVEVEVLVNGGLRKARAIRELGTTRTIEHKSAPYFSTFEQVTDPTGIRVQVEGLHSGGTVNLDAAGRANVDGLTLQLAQPLTEAQLAHDRATLVSMGQLDLDGLTDAQLGRVLRSVCSNRRLATLVQREVADRTEAA